MHQPEPQPEPSRQDLHQGILPAARIIAALGMVGFGAIAWWPLWPVDLPAYGLADGAILAASGTVGVAIPTMLARMAVLRGWFGRRSRTWLVVSVVLAMAALYIVYFWASLMLYFRDPANTFLW